MRGSRVSSPDLRSILRSSSSYRRSARAIPRRSAPAWPVTPPPCTFATMSNVVGVCATSRGCRTCRTRDSRCRYSRIGRPFTSCCPVPGTRRTRATASLRRPVARYAVGVGIFTSSRIQLCGGGCGRGPRRLRLSVRPHLRLLRLVRVFGAGVDAELLELRPAQLGVRHHAAHGAEHDLLRPAVEENPHALYLEAARVARVAHVRLL